MKWVFPEAKLKDTSQQYTFRSSLGHSAQCNSQKYTPPYHQNIVWCIIEHEIIPPLWMTGVPNISFGIIIIVINIIFLCLINDTAILYSKPK